MPNATAKPRSFLFLQGPHGPFFAQLAEHLRQTGATCWKVAFNAGDLAEWPAKSREVTFDKPSDQWTAVFEEMVQAQGITDLVLYGDTRPHHAKAIHVAKARGLTVHIFEEGYLRPYWATYERDGANGNSLLMQISLGQMARALEETAERPAMPPDRWGDLRHHMLHGALYHWHVLFRNQAFPNYRPHRDQTVGEEFRLHALRLLRLPRHAAQRWLATRRIRAGGWPFHVVLLQLEHDASFRSFSSFTSQTEFIETVIEGFAAGSPAHHHLVFKAHPLEDDRAPLVRTIKACAEAHGLSGRVSYVRGGKLAYLLDAARTAVTVNSTAAHQALWRGLPVRAFGTSVYDKRDLVSHQSLPDFFAHPDPPDPELYTLFRQFLLETSQLPGGFYSAKGRAQLLRNVVDRMLHPDDPYTARLAPRASGAQHLRVVS